MSCVTLLGVMLGFAAAGLALCLTSCAVAAPASETARANAPVIANAVRNWIICFLPTDRFYGQFFPLKRAVFPLLLPTVAPCPVAVKVDQGGPVLMPTPALNDFDMRLTIAS